MNTNTEVAKRPRIAALDIIRGYFLMAIIVDHVMFSPSLLFLATGGGRMFASPAEGFFVISGILVGYLYGPKILSNRSGVRRKLWKRAGLLYILAVITTVLFTVWAFWLTPGDAPMATWAGSARGFILNTLTMRYAYGWTDFLPRYAVFMAVAPLMVWLLAKRKGLVLITTSVLIWAFLRTNPYTNPFAAWQLLFVAGVSIGFYLPAIEGWFQKRPAMFHAVVTRPLIGIALLTFAASICLFVLPVLINPAAPTTHIELFDKNTLGFGRLALGAVWFTALYILVRRFESPINRFSKGVLTSFGSHSLLTYVVHGVVLFGFATFVHPGQSNLVVNTLATIGVIGIVYAGILSIESIKRVKLRKLLLQSGVVLRSPERFGGTL